MNRFKEIAIATLDKVPDLMLWIMQVIVIAASIYAVLSATISIYYDDVITALSYTGLSASLLALLKIINIVTNTGGVSSPLESK